MTPQPDQTATPRRIALALHEDSGFIRQIIRGIADFFGPTQPWALYRVPPESLTRGARVPADCAGVITHVHHPAVIPAVRRGRRPVVSISRLHRDDPFPHVGADDAAVGAIAANHLRDRGLTSFAFIGLAGFVFSNARQAGFEVTLDGSAPITRTSRVIPRGWLTRTPMPGSKRIKALDEWLVQLPRPTGLLAANDAVAWFIIERCRAVGLRVPLDLAIVGVDNDDVMCRLSHPRLTSVLLPGERIGYIAAERLVQAIESRGPVEPVELPPLRVEVRQSSEVYAVADADVAAAMAFIRSHATEGINVEDVLRAVPTGRRTLERGFRKAIQRTPLDEIHRVRVEAAKELLATTRLPIDQVAERVGFSQANYFARIFRRHGGATPREFRRLTR